MKVILRGVRPAALTAVSERERLKARPHRAQAAVNHARALAMAAALTVEEPIERPVEKPAKKRGRR